MSERKLTDEILLAASKVGARLFRQNTGVGWVGKIIKKTSSTITLEHPRPLHAGLCVGSSDIIGILPRVITQEDVGKTVGVFVATEIKQVNGHLSVEQERFLAMVRLCGGIAVTARCVDDLLIEIKKPD